MDRASTSSSPQNTRYSRSCCQPRAVRPPLPTAADRSVTPVAYRNMARAPAPDTAARALRHRGSFLGFQSGVSSRGSGSGGMSSGRAGSGRNRAAADGDDVLRRHRLWLQAPGHAVGGGGIEAVAGEEGPGRCLRHDAAVKEQGAAVGIPGAELHVVADHQHASRPRASSVRRISAKACLNSASRPLVGSSSSRISGSSSSTLARAARCCSPPDRS